MTRQIITTCSALLLAAVQTHGAAANDDKDSARRAAEVHDEATSAEADNVAGEGEPPRHLQPGNPAKKRAEAEGGAPNGGQHGEKASSPEDSDDDAAGDAPPLHEQDILLDDVSGSGDAGPVLSTPIDSGGTSAGRLAVETTPPGAAIQISTTPGGEGRSAGNTPQKIRLPRGKYWITVTRDGYETAVAEVAIDEGRTTSLRIALERERSGAVRGLRTAGHVLFWPGLVTAAVGIGLIAADDPAEDVNTGKAGFATAGVGVAMTVVGGILLGVTYRDKSVYTIPTVAAGPTSDGQGAIFSLHGAF